MLVSLLGLLGETVLVDFDPGEDGPEGAGDGLDGGVDEAVPDPAEAVDAELEEPEREEGFGQIFKICSG